MQIKTKHHSYSLIHENHEYYIMGQGDRFKGKKLKILGMFDPEETRIQSNQQNEVFVNGVKYDFVNEFYPVLDQNVRIGLRLIAIDENNSNGTLKADHLYITSPIESLV